MNEAIGDLLPFAVGTALSPFPIIAIVLILATPRAHVNGLEVAKSEMAERVKTVLEDKRERVVLIKGDQDASYSAIMAAMDDLRKAQIEDIGLITERKRQPGQMTGGK